jgi:chitodextrinase
MIGRRIRIFTLTLAFTGAVGLSAASAAAGGKPPTPTNFRVTAKTPFSVSLAWDSPRASSGSFSYRLSSTARAPAVTLPKTATSYTWNTGIVPGNTYWFFLYAVDSSGKTSGQVTLSTTVPCDTTPPSVAPVLSVAEVGSNYATLTWTAAQDDGPYLFYEVWKDGVRYFSSTTGRVFTVRFLEPRTAYSFSVRAFDYGSNVSPFSNAVTVTTLPPNPDDTTPPTTPGDLVAWTFGDGSGETHLFWTQSTDDFDEPEHIRYDVYVNGVWSDVLFGSGGPSLVYGSVGIVNRIEVIASDTAGNTSDPATVTVDLRF